MSGLLGVIYPIAFAFGYYIIKFSLPFHFFFDFFLLSASLIADFTSVLIDAPGYLCYSAKAGSANCCRLAAAYFAHIYYSTVPFRPSCFYVLEHLHGLWGSSTAVDDNVVDGICYLLLLMPCTWLFLRFTSPQRFSLPIIKLVKPFLPLLFMRRTRSFWPGIPCVDVTIINIATVILDSAGTTIRLAPAVLIQCSRLR